MTQPTSELLERLHLRVDKHLACSPSQQACLRVHTEDDTLALLTLWQTETQAKRAVAADPLTSSLEVTPDLLESAPSQRWTLHTAPLGVQLQGLLEAQGLHDVSHLSESSRTTLLKNLGGTIHTLHKITLDPQQIGEPLFDGGEAKNRTLHSYLVGQLNHYEPPTEDILVHCMALRHELSTFHPRTRCVLNHGELGAHQIWVDEEDFSITAITGFGESKILPTSFDFAYLTRFDPSFAQLGERDLRVLYGACGAARTMDLQRRERFFGRFIALEMLLGYREQPEALDEAHLLGRLQGQ